MGQPDENAQIGVEFLPPLCCLFGAAVLFGAGYGIWDNVAVNLHIVALFASLLCYIGAFSLIVLGFMRSRHATTAVIVAIAFAFVVYAASYVLFKVPSYDSDSMLFNSYSAQLLMGGLDPYAQTMQPGYRIFGVAEGVTTPTLNGDEVYALSYPALSFLVYVPFLALGVTNLLWVSVAAHLLIMLMLVQVAPKPFKALAPFVLFLDSTYFDYTLGGITDVLWIPAGMLTAMYWKRNPTAAAAWLGVACAFKQTPWVIVPFAAVHWFRAARASRRSSDFVRPAIVMMAAFAVPNLPFVVWHPHAWFAGVTTPITAHLIVLGTGIAQLATSGLVTLSAKAFTAMTMLSFAIIFALYIALPRRLAFLPFLAPALVFFFASRSLHNYFMYWPIILTTYLFANWKDDCADLRAESVSRAKAAGLAAICALGLMPLLAKPASADVQVKIMDGSRNAITGRIDTLHILVTNSVSRPIFMHFDVAEQGVEVDVQAWKPRVLQKLEPGETRAYTIVAPSNEFQLESDGSTATQIFVVDTEGQESYSAPVVFSARTPKIRNPDLAFWSVGSRPFPIAWQFDANAWRTGLIAKTAIAGKDAVAIRIARSPKGGSSPTLLEQITDARPGNLTFSLYPETDYSGGADATDLFGVELRDIVGHEIYYTIDSRRRTSILFRSKQRTVVVVPGRLHAWNTIPVDLVGLESQSGFILSPSATMVVGAVAFGKTSGTTLAGYFGGIQSFQTSLPSNMSLRAEGVAALPARTVLHAGAARIAPVFRSYLIDDLPSSAGGSIAYVGRWEHLRGARDGRYLGTSSRSYSAGSVATLDFEGTGLRIYGVRGPSGGRALISVDGSKGSVDFFSPHKVTRTVVFAVSQLEDGKHRFQIVVEPAPRTARKRKFVNIDFVEIRAEQKKPFTQEPISVPIKQAR